mmetsp:Transcript_94267/g.272407  ORF Transcript_94267/g.272407 Transcript_94267/m.272407 type:complete len:436 (+) Transcript_94267:74-1381(+)
MPRIVMFGLRAALAAAAVLGGFPRLDASAPLFARDEHCSVSSPDESATSLLQLGPISSLGMGNSVDLCAPSPEEMRSNAAELRRLMDTVAYGNWSVPIEAAWADFQSKTLLRLQAARPAPARKLRILVGVALAQTSLPMLVYNFKKWSKNKAGDTFNFVLLHFDAEEGKLPTLPADVRELLMPHVALRHAGPGCKVDFWKRLAPDFVAGYDYLWLPDDDLRMDFFDWDFYRYHLLAYNPLVSQPSVVGWAPKRRSSDWNFVRATHSSNTSWVTRKIEAMTPVISTKIWPAIFSRAWSVNASNCFAIEGIISNIANEAKALGCFETPLLVVNTPMRHADCRSMASGYVWSLVQSQIASPSRTHCFRGYVWEDCFGMSEKEADLLAQALGGECAAAKDPKAWKGKCVCFQPGTHIDRACPAQGKLIFPNATDAGARQ